MPKVKVSVIRGDEEYFAEEMSKALSQWCEVVATGVVTVPVPGNKNFTAVQFWGIVKYTDRGDQD